MRISPLTVIPWLLALACALAPVSTAAAGELTPVSIVVHWKHQAQWAGYYMAKEKGIYEKYGLSVTFLERQGRSDSLDLLMDGRVTFATHFLSAGAGLRGHKQPIVLVGQMFNRSNLMIVARRSAGVDSITDLSGKVVCYWDGYYRFVFQAFFRSQGVRDLVERPMGLTVTPFTSKQVVACSAMEYNEYNLIRTSPDVAEGDIVSFKLREMGMDFPEDAIYTSEAFARDNPETCRAFVRATLEGWQYAKDHPEEAIAVVLQETAKDRDPLVTEAHQRWMLGVCVDSVLIPEDKGRKRGVLSRKDFEVMTGFLKENGQLPNMYPYEDFVKLEAAER